MAKCEMDPANLKSFQKISQEDLRYLKELGKATAGARELTAIADEVHNEPMPREKFALNLLPMRIKTWISTTVDRLLYETVPANEVYASRE